jgi:hypothetical protein
MAAIQQVRIFSHDTQREFPSEDDLRTWLLNGLRGNGGVYCFRRANAVDDLPPGSIVLFRYHEQIVGEAVVREGKKVYKKKKYLRTLSGQELDYAAEVTFAPASIRLYSPPLPVDVIQGLLTAQKKEKNIVTYAGGYPKLDWEIYACILKEVVSRGVFLS